MAADEKQEQKQDKEPKPEGELLKLGNNMICGKDNHFFTYISSMEVKCKKCPVGYPVSVNTQLVDGHLYIDDLLLI